MPESTRLQPMQFLIIMPSNEIAQVTYIVEVEPLHDNAMTDTYIHYIIVPYTKVPFVEWYTIDFALRS